MLNWIGKWRATKKGDLENYERTEKLSTDLFRMHHQITRPCIAPFVLIKILGFWDGQRMLVLAAREENSRVTILTPQGEVVDFQMTPEMQYEISWTHPGIDSGIAKNSYLTFLGALDEILESDPSMAGKVCRAFLQEPIDGIKNRVVTNGTNWYKQGTEKLFVIGFNACAIVPLEDLEQILLEAKVNELEHLKTSFKKIAYGVQLAPGDYAKFGNELVGHKSGVETFLIIEQMPPTVVGGKLANAIGLNLKTRRCEPLYTKEMHKTGDINRSI